MINDTERREVARRLRYWTDNPNTTIRDIPGAWAILRIEVGAKTWREVYLYLADLIDPGGNIPGEVCEIEGFGQGEPLPPIVDRDALLKLADEIEYGAGTDDGEYDDMPGFMVAAIARQEIAYARRIREALGVGDD